jgi:pilus assembly protein CpaF
MDLQERLSSTTPGDAGTHERDPFAEIKNRIHLGLVSELGPRLFGIADSASVRSSVESEIQEQLLQEQSLSTADRTRLSSEISADILGYGPLERLLADATVSEIMVNGSNKIWVERDGLLFETSLRFDDESHLRRIINKMVGQVGRRIDESSPMVDARLPDGSRVNAIIPPLSLTGPLLTIRKFARDRFDFDDLVGIGTLSQTAADFLRLGIRAKLNILISGGTGTGKTTLLNALSESLPDTDRIVTIEDAAELQLQQRHVLRLEARPPNIENEGEVTIRDLVRNALRMRPDRIIVGEVRGAEALDMLQAMNTGHEGSLSTVHANSPRDALSRVETMVLMAGFELPVKAVRQYLSSALDLIVQIERLEDGTRHVTSLTEVQRMESDMITLQPLFEYKVYSATPDGKVVGSLEATGLRPTLLKKFERRGIEVPPGLFGLPLGSGETPPAAAERTLVEQEATW